MTPIALLYFILGLLTLAWPLALLLFKPRVLGAQWFLAVALFCLAVSTILYSCFFNTFLSGEYLLVILFMLFALVTPPVAMLAVSHLTRPQGIRRLSRALFLIPAATVLLLIASVVIGGPDMYRLWISRGAQLQASLFFLHSWRYNLIVSVHYYLFHIVVLLQTLMLTVHTFRSLRRYRSTVREYHTQNAHTLTSTRQLSIPLLAYALLVILTLALFPFNAPRPFTLTLVITLLQALAVIVLGIHTYRLSRAAETLRRDILRSPHTTSRRDLAALGRQLSAYVEQNAYLDPDLSVFSLAEHFHVSQDQVVDAIHTLHGQPFADYIDSLRIQHAISLLDNPHLHTDDTDLVAHIAHQCGYLTPQALQQAYRKVMKSNLPIA